MNIGDKVRFLNDVGGGKITGFRPGGIVLVEDEDGFDVPILQNEVVVIEENEPKTEKPKPSPKVEYGAKPIQPEATKHLKTTEKEGQSKKEERAGGDEENTLNGKEYLKSKTVSPTEEDEVDENLEARVVRLEMTIQKLEARVARLEAENNLRKNQKMMTRSPKPNIPTPPPPPQNLDTLQIL